MVLFKNIRIKYCFIDLFIIKLIITRVVEGRINRTRSRVRPQQERLLIKVTLNHVPGALYTNKKEMHLKELLTCAIVGKTHNFQCRVPIAEQGQFQTDLILFLNDWCLTGHNKVVQQTS